MASRNTVGTSTSSLDTDERYLRGFFYYSLLKDVTPENRFVKGDAPLARRTCVAVSNMKPLRIPAEVGEFIKATLSCTVSSVRHFLHLAGSEETLTKIDTAAQNAIADGKPQVAVNPEKGALVLAKNNDRYNRAVVVEKSKFDSTSVFFVDYGNNAMVNPDDIFLIEDEFLLQTPPQAFCVDLKEVESRDLREEEYLLLNDCRNVSVHIVGVSKDGVAFVVDMLYLKEGQIISIAETLKKMISKRNCADREQRTFGSARPLELERRTSPVLPSRPVVNPFERPVAKSFSVDLSGHPSRQQAYSDSLPPARHSPDSMPSTGRKLGEKRLVCYECGEPGHVRRDCPKVRSTAKDYAQNHPTKSYSTDHSKEFSLNFSADFAQSQSKDGNKRDCDPYKAFPFMREVMKKAEEEERKKAAGKTAPANLSNAGYARASSRSPKRHGAGQRRNRRSESSNEDEKGGSFTDDWSDVDVGGPDKW